MFVLKAARLLCSIFIAGYCSAQPAEPFADELYCTWQLPAWSNLLSLWDIAAEGTSDEHVGIGEGGAFPEWNKVRNTAAPGLHRAFTTLEQFTELLGGWIWGVCPMVHLHRATALFAALEPYCSSHPAWIAESPFLRRWDGMGWGGSSMKRSIGLQIILLPPDKLGQFKGILKKHF